jgi:hypothetical protein
MSTLNAQRSKQERIKRHGKQSDSLALKVERCVLMEERQAGPTIGVNPETIQKNGWTGWRASANLARF